MILPACTVSCAPFEPVNIACTLRILHQLAARNPLIKEPAIIIVKSFFSDSAKMTGPVMTPFIGTARMFFSALTGLFTISCHRCRNTGILINRIHFYEFCFPLMT